MQQTIEKFQKSDAKSKNYSNIARVKDELTTNRERIEVNSKSKKSRMIREFMITIDDEEEKAELQKMFTKKIMNKMQSEKKEIRRIARLTSEALKIQTKSAKIKNVLQKKQKILRRVIEFVTIRARIFSVKINEIKIEHIDIINQTEVITYLQIINARSHSSLKIINIA